MCKSHLRVMRRLYFSASLQTVKLFMNVLVATYFCQCDLVTVISHWMRKCFTSWLAVGIDCHIHNYYHNIYVCLLYSNQAARRQSGGFLCYLCPVFFANQTDLWDSSAVPHQKWLAPWSYMKNSLRDFANLSHNFYRGSKSEKFDFLIPVAFKVLWFRNWATNRKSKKCSGSIRDCSNIYSQNFANRSHDFYMGVNECKIWPLWHSGFETKQRIRHLKQTWGAPVMVLWPPQILGLDSKN